ncbi:polyamine ABC transporter substrate-binding protein [Nocardiopsis coralliicola]
MARPRSTPVPPPRPGRRAVRRGAGLAAAAWALAGCGVGGSRAEPVTAAEFWDGKESSGRLSFANWPLYMDPERAPLAAFTEETGIAVDYDEAVQENHSFYGRIRPALEAGDPVGYDLMVLSGGIELTRLLAQNHLAPLDHRMLPNLGAHVADRYKRAAYDEGNRYTVPYASGITGIAYNPDYVDREITRIADLWDPEFAGKVGMLADPQELANYALLLDGTAPAGSGRADWERAADRLTEQRDAGIVRRYYESDYIQPLSNGDLWLSMAWSGDVHQRNAEEGTRLEFVLPDEGATLWSDLMMIPYTAENPVDAAMLMDFLLAPETAAQLAAEIAFITPVPQARDVLRERAAADGVSDAERAELERTADSPLVFPAADDYDRLHDFVPVPLEQAEDFTALFQSVTRS